MNNLLKNYKNISLPVKASIWFVICSFIQKGIAFITTPLYTRLMSTSEYGITVIYSSWLQIVAIFATFQLSTGVFNKAMIKYESNRDSYTSSSLFLTSCITGVWFLIYLINPSFWNTIFDLPTIMVIMMFADIFFSTAMSFWGIRNRFEYKYKSVIIFTLIVHIFGPLLSVVMISFAFEHQAEAKVLGMLAVKIIVYLVVYILIMKRGKKIIAVDHWKYSLSYNLPLIPHYLSQQVLTQSDRIMINKMCGSSDAGVYGVAYQLSMVLFTVTLAIHNSFTPWTFECMKEKKYCEIGKVAIYLEIAIGFVCFVFSLFAPELIYLLGGKEYSAAVWIIPPVTMSILFQTIYTFFGNVEFYFEKTKMVMIASIVCAVANVVLNVIFIPYFGFVAAGYTTLACYVLYGFIHYIFMCYICRKENIPAVYNGKKIWGISFLYILLNFAATMLYGLTIIRYILICFIAVLFITISIIYKEKILKLLSR